MSGKSGKFTLKVLHDMHEKFKEKEKQYIAPCDMCKKEVKFFYEALFDFRGYYCFECLKKIYLEGEEK